MFQLGNNLNKRKNNATTYILGNSSKELGQNNQLHPSYSNILHLFDMPSWKIHFLLKTKPPTIYNCFFAFYYTLYNLYIKLKTFFLRKKLLLAQLIACIPMHCIYAYAQANQALPIKEIIVGVQNIHKKELQKYSIYQPHSTFLAMPIRKWLYQCGKRSFNPEKIKNHLLHIKNRYEHKIKEATSEKEKTRLMLKRDNLIESKEKMLTHGNYFMRIGEKPTYYDPTYVQHNEKMFLNYMHSKGYLDAEITSKTDFQKKIVRVTYYINKQNLYKIASTRLQVQNKQIRDLLEKHKNDSFIKVGHAYMYQDFVNERERIITLLSNNGYFEFEEKYVCFTADVSQHNYTIATTAIINKPSSKTDHTKTKIERVIVDLTPQTRNKESNTHFQTKEREGVHFLVKSEQYPLDILVCKIAIRPGDFYNKSKILETYERLNRTAIFESITILPKLEKDQLVIYIHAKPHVRVTLQTELGGECINLNLKHLRPTIKLAPTIRRIWGGLGTAHIETSIAWRDQLESDQTESNQTDRFYQQVEYGSRLKFTTPSCCMIFVSKRTDLMLEKFSPSTTINFGYSFMKNRICSRQKLDSALSYDWYNQNKNISYQFSPFKSTYTHPKTTKEIPKLLPSFFTTIGCASSIRNTNTTAYLSTIDSYRWIVSIGLEHGGLYEFLFPIKKILPKECRFYKYIKIDLSFCHSFNLTEHTILAYQTKLGTAKAYGATDTIPLDKQYQAGGHGNVRAWDAQMVGPGFDERQEEKKNNRREEKKNSRASAKLEENQEVQRGKGDLLLLGNIELRQKLIGYLEGALFLDVGNTWRLSKQALPETKFHFNNFYKALAVGGGFGLRLNFNNTFVLCWDIAFQLHKPSGKKLTKPCPVNFNLSIGYPF